MKNALVFIRPCSLAFLIIAAGNVECIKLLIGAGADLECLDVKAQSPLFVSLVNQHWGCAQVLLEAGANPNGSPANLCSPLSIMCQRGFYEGIKVRKFIFYHNSGHNCCSCCASLVLIQKTF